MSVGGILADQSMDACSNPQELIAQVTPRVARRTLPSSPKPGMRPGGVEMSNTQRVRRVFHVCWLRQFHCGAQTPQARPA